MGTWGTAISSNDTYADVYAAFFEYYNNDLHPSEITQKLINSNKAVIDDKFDSNNFWFALAKAQWECKYSDQAVLNKVKIIIEAGIDLKLWEELGADDASLKRRKVILDKFLNDLSTPRSKAKSVKKKTLKDPVYSKGDCITFKLNNGNYGGAVILEAIYNTAYPYNLVATTNINSLSKPTITDFINSNVLVKTFASYKDKPAINWVLPVRHKQTAHLFEKVGTIDVEVTYDIKEIKYNFCGDYDIYVIGSAVKQLEHELSNGKSKVDLPMKQFIKKSRWKLW